MDSASRALRRLRDPHDPSTLALARLMVEQTTATPLRALVTPRFVAGQLAAALEAASHGDHLRAWADARIAAERVRWSAESRTASTWLSAEAEGPLRELLGRPYAPNEELVLRLIDQPALRELLRVVLTQTVARFRRRVAEVDGVLGDIGKRAAATGRGLFGNLTEVAGHIVGAVREEVDHALEGRVREFVQGATAEALRSIASYLADPAHAPAFASMRLAFLDVLLDTPISELTAEADKLQPEQMIDVVVGAVRAAVAAPDFVDRVQDSVATTLDELGDGTLGAWLEEVGLADVWTETTTELVRQRLDAVVSTDAFTHWWEALHAP